MKELESRRDLPDPIVGRRGTMRFTRYGPKELRIYSTNSQVHVQLMLPQGGEPGIKFMMKAYPNAEQRSLRERVYEMAANYQVLNGRELMAVRYTILGQRSGPPAPPAPGTPVGGLLRRSPARAEGSGAAGSGLSR